jgi:predicted RNase H-like HicB family nuclease
MKRKYYVIFENEGGNYGAFCPDVPGCIGTGSSLEEAKKDIAEALEFYLEDVDSIPDASGIDKAEKIVCNEYKNDNVKCISDVEIALPVKKSRRINITIPELTLSVIDDYLKSHRDKENRSAFLTEAAEEYIRLHA